jgi:hypothetical protein
VCEKVFLVLPQYNLGASLMAMTMAQLERSIAAQFGVAVVTDDMQLYRFENVGGKLLCLAIEGV